MSRSVKMRKWIAATAVVGMAVGVGVWRANAGGGPSSFLAGPLRVVGVHADTAAGPITDQEALNTITAKLAQMEPQITWDTAIEPTWNVSAVTNMTRVYDAFDGHLLYSRTMPINAVVAELRHGTSWVFGIVADTADTPANCHAMGCDPPGTLLDAQAFITP